MRKSWKVLAYTYIILFILETFYRLGDSLYDFSKQTERIWEGLTFFIKTILVVCIIVVYLKNKQTKKSKKTEKTENDYLS